MNKLIAPLTLCLIASPVLAQFPCFDGSLGTQLTLSDDSFSPVLTLGFTFHHDQIPYTSVQVCSNGYVVLGSGSPGFADYTPSVTELLSNPQPRVCPIWRDLNPSSNGSGKVWYNAVPASGGNPAYFSVTYDGVYQYGTATPITCQILFVDGDVIQIHHDENVGNGTNPWLIGASPGNGAIANPVVFSNIPVVTTGPTLHEDGTSGFALSGATSIWTPVGNGYVVVPATGCAASLSYGEGCLTRYGSFYELFDLPGTTNDLGGSSFTLINTGIGYVTVVGSTAPRGSATATNLNMADDQEITVPFASGATAMPVPGGVVTGLTVSSNGIVSTDTNTTSWTPSVGAFLGLPNTVWAVGWHDLRPANGTVGSGGVYVEETATHFYVIYDAVQSYGAPGSGNTMELHYDKTTGNVEYVIVSVDNLGNDYLVGFSMGGASLDPGPADLSALTVINVGSPEVLPLALEAASPPVVNAGMHLVTSNITSTAAFGGLLFGITKFDPGISLAPLGMQDCFQYNDQLAVRLFFPGGASSVAVPVTIPNAVGVAIQVQSVVYDPVAGLTTLGAVASNGVELLLGN